VLACTAYGVELPLAKVGAAGLQRRHQGGAPLRGGCGAGSAHPLVRGPLCHGRRRQRHKRRRRSPPSVHLDSIASTLSTPTPYPTSPKSRPLLSFPEHSSPRAPAAPYGRPCPLPFPQQPLLGSPKSNLISLLFLTMSSDSKWWSIARIGRS
jgi:hypothetical protein